MDAAAGRPYASAVAASHSSAEDVRLSELLVVLSLGADLGMGQPMEHERPCRPPVSVKAVAA